MSIIIKTQRGKRIYDGIAKKQVSVYIPQKYLDMWDELAQRNATGNRTLTLRWLIEKEYENIVNYPS